MSEHLLLVAVGPVQDFIAQARRTRDLWFGSHVLSEISRAAARYLSDQEARLVFPAIGDPAELAPCLKPLRENGTPPENVANKVLAEVPDGLDPRRLARDTREAVRRFWREEMVLRVRRECRSLIADDAGDAWDEQIDTFLEFTASWAELTPERYREARAEVERAVAARKGLRDFQPWRHLRGGFHKSSLDGERETVLRPPTDRDPRLVKRYRIERGEHLDAVGLVKRAGGEPGQFVPVVNVALACWVDRAAREAPGALQALRHACGRLDLAPVNRPDVPAAKAFPIDASVLVRSRWAPVFEERELPGDPREWGRRHVGPLYRVLDEPFPYVACLVADGDRMGRAINGLARADDHRRISRALADFARSARRIVQEREHLGSLVYAGGDDVLAFLPLPTAVGCAASLREAFASAMKDAGLDADGGPTLSVGIGAGHFMEGMGDLLDLGREAERLAKQGEDGRGGRNALAVVVQPRSGETLRWRAGWETDPTGRLRRAAEALEHRLPTGKVHEIARTLRHLPATAGDAEPGWSATLAGEARRSLSRAGTGDAGVDPAEVGLELHGTAGYADVRREVESWVRMMLVARTFAAAGSRPPAPGEGAA